MAQQIKKTSAVWFLTGILLCVLCIGVSIVVLIKPYEYIQTYLHIIFMDQNMKIVPSDGLDGLVIQENEIETGEASDGQTYYEDGEIVRPTFGEQYAVLQCDSISLSVPVYWGSAAELLELGACQATSSVVIGEKGNVVIDAHVNTFFADLNQLQTGDAITLYTSYGIFKYQVTQQVQFENTDKTYILPTEEDRLTLYTCEAQVLGTSSSRIGVLCNLVSKQFYQPTAGEE